MTKVVEGTRLAVLALLNLIWLLPFLWVGSTLGRLPFRVPNRLWQQYDAAGLFTRRAPVWSDWQIEVRRAGSTEWSVLNLAEVAPMPASGYRLRLDRILGDTRSKPIAESLRQRLAEWLAQSLKQQKDLEVSGVRYLHRSWQTNTPELACPAGHWNGGEGQALPVTTRVSMLGEYAIANGRATLERAKPRVPGAEPPQPSIFRRATPAGAAG